MANTRSLFQGVAKWHFLTAEPSSLAAITQAEIGAGTEVTGTHGEEAAFDGSGWEPSYQTITDEDWAAKDPLTVDHTTTWGIGTIRFKRDHDTHPILDLYVADTPMWVVLAYSGDTTAGEQYYIYETVIMGQYPDVASGVQSWTGAHRVVTAVPGEFAA